MEKIITVCNQKGGVGKTTTAVNLSAALAVCAQKQVLLIDFDPQGNATSGLGIDKNSQEATIYDVLMNGRPVQECLLSTDVDNLRLTPSNINLTGAEVELVQAEGRDYRLKEALSQVQEMFDFIIIDSPPSLGLLTINALTASHSVLMPIQCEYYALEGLTQLLQTIELVRGGLNPALMIEGVLLTMADYRTNLTNEVVNEVREFFKDKVYDTIIPRSIRLSEAPGFGKPIELYDSKSVAAERYRRFTEEVLQRNATQEQGAPTVTPAAGETTQPVEMQGVINE